MSCILLKFYFLIEFIFKQNPLSYLSLQTLISSLIQKLTILLFSYFPHHKMKLQLDCHITLSQVQKNPVESLNTNFKNKTIS